MTHTPPQDTGAPVKLELSILGAPTGLDTLRFAARYVATQDVVVFHRLVGGECPDALSLTFTDAVGAQTVVQPVSMSMPTATRLLARDYVTVTVDAPVSFEFDTWGPSELAPGAYTVVATYVGGVTTYTTDAGDTVETGAYAPSFVSNPVPYRHTN